MGSNGDLGKEIEELQVLESHIQNFLIQKQSIQMEVNEMDNALEEIKNSDGEVYKMVSGIMIKTEKVKIKKELEERKKSAQMKVNAIEKQEEILNKSASELRSKVNQKMKKEDDRK